MIDGRQATELTGAEIAIIGMACRLPGASEIERYWQNLIAGVESLTTLEARDLERSGLDPALLADPAYVPRASVLDDIESFDADFFGYTPLEARLMDPQHRLFLECAVEAFEQAGYDPERFRRPVGVFTGAKTNTYLFSIFSNRELFRSLDSFQIALGNDLASMATRVSYKLDLTGPSYALHTACSTSLVAVHLACQSLLLGECDLALAGGAAVNVPQKKGYRYQKGGILSPDGSCRTFDAGAAGSNFGNGVGAVLLSRLGDAVAAGDHVYAVIKGSATNNDGAAKASYTAPGVAGQTAVLLDAMAAAGVSADDLSYIEAHGTATDLGDSIEMLALTQAFRASTERRGFCAVGSVKTNLGHLETAAGVAGLIKTALALEREQLPPSLHFEQPNPKIDFAASPFFVNGALTPWPRGDRPRRAGVSSFGIGSTNAHVILEEAPPPEPADPPRPPHLLLLSAQSEPALESATARLREFLAQRQGEGRAPELADVAFTLQVGRKGYTHRRMMVVRDLPDALEVLAGLPPERVPTHPVELADRPLVFLFPGLGDHYPEMARGLYDGEPVFRAELDRAAEHLHGLFGFDIREALYRSGPAAGAPSRLDLKRMLGRAGAVERGPLDRVSIAHPALFAVEVALARLLAAWGLAPKAMIGYSLSEYVAATLAGVLSFEDALRLVGERARWVEALAPGAMLAVPLGEEAVRPLLSRHGLALAVEGGPALTVLSGPVAAVEAAEAELAAREVITRCLATDRAFHSPEMVAAAAPLAELAASMELSPPRVPYLSNLTGDWITAAQATDPGYWAAHLTGTVRFGAGLERLLSDPVRLYLEVGPGQNLGSFLRQHPACTPEAARAVLPTLRNAYGAEDDRELLLGTLGRLWLHGQRIDWEGFYRGERRRRVPLPTYPFERQRYWVDPPAWDGAGAGTGMASPPRPEVPAKRPDPADWFYAPVLRPEELPAEPAPLAAGPVWVFDDGAGLGEALGRQLTAAGAPVLRLLAGPGEGGGGTVAVRPGEAADLQRLIQEHGAPAAVYHLWSAAPVRSFAEELERGFYSLVSLAQALGRASLPATVPVVVAAAGLVRGEDGDLLVPERAVLLGPARVMPQEVPRLATVVVDLPVPAAEGYGERAEPLAAALAAERSAIPVAELLVHRRGRRHRQVFEPLPLPAPEGPPPLLRSQGVYLITGGLGGVGLRVARHLAVTVGARLVLCRRTPFPPREAWADWQREHGGDDPTSAVITELEALEADGGQVLTTAADVTSEDDLGRVLAAARERFGRLDGVFHLAGVPGGGILQLKTRDIAERVLAPKVHGTLALRRAVTALAAEERPSFVVLFSSIASILGEFGQADYCGANAFLDALAQGPTEAWGGARVLTIGWDLWQEVGIGVLTEVPAHLQDLRQEMLQRALVPAEGVAVLDRALGAALPQVLVSTQELAARVEFGRSLTGEAFLRQVAALPAARSAPRARPAAGGAALTGGAAERRIAEVWARVLGVDEVGVHENFFELGGNSLVGLQLVSELSQELDLQIPPVALFEHPTVAALTRSLFPEAPAESAASLEERLAERRRQVRGGGAGRAIAVVAMTGRFPGAPTVGQLWENLAAGKESITFFSDEELRAAGVAEELLANPDYVRAGAILDGVDLFDAGLFGYSPREAEIMDPQHRVFLECAWEALEKAGVDPHQYPGSIGVFAGCNVSSYLLQLHADPQVRGAVNVFQALLGNDKDSLTTTVSYKLDLRGPSVAVQTFCSTSLVAVYLACQSLRNGDCDMALAGGIRIVTPVKQGYLYEEGGIAPRDGHCRSFDARGDGSMFGNGAGIVVLKRLADALEDGDPVLAVIQGAAINNDGSLKAGYTAPSVAGQAAVVTAALEDSGVDPATITYVEAHGSATALGDPIEVRALTQAYRRYTDERGYCRIGSVKSNFNHLDRAAGVTGLIKTVLALQHRRIPPSINFQEPNPQIDFDGSPFRVNTELVSWEPRGGTRRAGVNSLGVGGTNVHLVVEEAPPVPPGGPARPWQLLVLSARSEEALVELEGRLAEHLESHPELALADVAYTLQRGRRALPRRRAVVVRDGAMGVRVLGGQDPRRRLSGEAPETAPEVVFLFPGLGGQYVGMARGLYEDEPVFRDTVDRCAGILQEHLGFDLREALWPPRGAEDEPPVDAAVDLRQMLRRSAAGVAEDPATERLNRTEVSQPALFVLQYALARLWQAWGVRPRAMVGYSLGEYVAACVAGVLSLEDALELVAVRARWIAETPAGALLAVALPADGVVPYLGPEVSLMAENGPEQSVLAGPAAVMADLEERLAADGVACRRLAAGHAFHSHLMEPLYERMAELARSVTLRPPQVPYLSNLTGDWVTASEVTDPEYWARHLCRPVRFAQAAEKLLTEPGRVLLEVGPGQTLGALVLQHPAAGRAGRAPLSVSSLRHEYEKQADPAHLLTALARLWLAGVPVDWDGVHGHGRRLKVELPTYPFERRRYWIDARPAGSAATTAGRPRLLVPSFVRAVAPAAAVAARPVLLVTAPLARGETPVEDLAAALAEVGVPVTVVAAPAGGAGAAAVEPWEALLTGLPVAPAAVAFLPGPDLGPEAGAVLRALGLALAAGAGGSSPPVLRPMVAGLHEVAGEELESPRQAVLLGAVQALAREAPALPVGVIDAPVPADGRWPPAVTAALAVELGRPVPEPLVVLRGRRRFLPVVSDVGWEAVALEPAGAFLWVGGLGPAAQELAALWAGRPGARLAVAEGPGFPAVEDWEEWLQGDGGGGLVSQRIQHLRTLEAAGAELLVTTADPRDRERLAAMLAEVQGRWGTLHGVALTVEPGSGGDALDSAVALHGALAGLAAPPVVRLLLSTAADATGGALLDAFAARAAEDGWTSVAWDLEPPPAAPSTARREVLERLLAAPVGPQVVVSASLPPGPWHRSRAEERETAMTPRTGAMGFYPRPQLAVEFVAPRNPTEETIARAWCELLGLEQVGVHDSFLDLGGDSLLATRLVSRLRESLALDLPIRLVFEASTVAELAAAIESSRERAEAEDLEELLALVEGLSEDEIEEQLRARRELSGKEA